MKIGIIGYGFVGQALTSVLNAPGQALIVDPDKGYNFIDGVKGILSNKPDIIFLCLPTPTVEGKCDDSLILEHVEKLKDFPGCVVIKSTIPPATVNKVMKIRPSTVVWPELLREANANLDIQYPGIIVIGAPSKMHFEFVNLFIQTETQILWKKGQNSTKVHHVTPTQASVFKYAVNSFLATKVVFFHQMYLWMRDSGRGDDYKEVINLLQEEGRIGHTHMLAPGEDGFGFAGSCFPKDVEALLGQVKEDNSTLDLLDQVLRQNQDLQDKQE